MAIEKETADGRMVCKVNGVLNIWEAANIWQDILPLLTASEPLTLDFSDVSECDGAGVQILCQIQKIGTTLSKKIDIATLSQPVATALQQAGLDPNLFTKHMEEI